MAQQFILRIAGSYTPDDLPLGRLGEYIQALSDLLGEQANVHFEDLREGSAMVVVNVDHVAAPKVSDRVRRISAGDASGAELKAYSKIDTMLRDDNATGEVVGVGDVVIHVDFPGRNRPRPLVYGPVRQSGVIDGEIFRIEGRDATVHVGVMDGQHIYSLEAPAARAQELAAFFRAGPIRFRGEGTWFRNSDAGWELKKFRIEDFSALDNSPLSQVIASLREVGFGDWAEVADPQAELDAERRGGDIAH